MTTTEIENFPGFPGGGISGPDLMMKMQKQAEEFGTVTKSEKVTKLSPGSPFTLETSVGLYRVRAVVLATGATAKYLGLASEKRFLNNGVSACATCDGALPRFRNKELVVVGGGDSAVSGGRRAKEAQQHVTACASVSCASVSPVLLSFLTRSTCVCRWRSRPS